MTSKERILKALNHEETDRVPVDLNGAALTGDAGVFKDTLQLFSQRILSTPVQKSESFEIVVRWTIVFN